MVIAQNSLNVEPGTCKSPSHLGNRKGSERQVEAVLDRRLPVALEIPLREDRQPSPTVLAHGLDEGDVAPAGRSAAKLDPVGVLRPIGDVRNQIDAQQPARLENTSDGSERCPQVALASQRLQDSVGGQHHLENAVPERQRTDIAAHKSQVMLTAPSPRNPSACSHAPRGPREHGCRAIYSNEGRAVAGERNRNPAGPASKFEHTATGGTRGDAPPERNIPSAERTSVFPVIERRVVVPARPAFAFAAHDGMF